MEGMAYRQRRGRSRPVTKLLVGINVLMFILMAVTNFSLNFSTETLFRWGGNLRPATIHGQWWRLVSCMFVHAGWKHLLANMAGLILGGLFLEPLTGSRRFLFIYMLTGIIAGCTSLFWYSATVSIGASGAILGIFGALISFGLLRVLPKKVNRLWVAGGAIFLGFYLFVSIQQGVDNAAHIGGLISGALLAVFYKPLSVR